MCTTGNQDDSCDVGYHLPEQSFYAKEYNCCDYEHEQNLCCLNTGFEVSEPGQNALHPRTHCRNIEQGKYRGEGEPTHYCNGEWLSNADNVLCFTESQRQHTDGSGDGSDKDRT